MAKVRCAAPRCAAPRCAALRCATLALLRRCAPPPPPTRQRPAAPQASLKAMGLTHGIQHTELKYTSKGARLLEVGAGSGGGGGGQCQRPRFTAPARPCHSCCADQPSHGRQGGPAGASATGGSLPSTAALSSHARSALPSLCPARLALTPACCPAVATRPPALPSRSACTLRTCCPRACAWWWSSCWPAAGCPTRRRWRPSRSTTLASTASTRRGPGCWQTTTSSRCGRGGTGAKLSRALRALLLRSRLRQTGLRGAARVQPSPTTPALPLYLHPGPPALPAHAEVGGPPRCHLLPAARRGGRAGALPPGRLPHLDRRGDGAQAHRAGAPPRWARCGVWGCGRMGCLWPGALRWAALHAGRGRGQGPGAALSTLPSSNAVLAPPHVPPLQEAIEFVKSIHDDICENANIVPPEQALGLEEPAGAADGNISD